MAFPPKSSVESIDSETASKGAESKSKNGTTTPPPASPKPRPASSDSSLYSSAGKGAMLEGQSGLGAEGSNPALVGIQGMALVQRGIQMLNLAFPENPGLVATLADLTGRLQTLIPQLVSQSAQPGMGLLGGMMGQGMMGQQMGMGGMPGGAPGMGGGMAPPPGGGGMMAPPVPMGGGGMPPQGGPTMGPPMPPIR